MGAGRARTPSAPRSPAAGALRPRCRGCGGAGRASRPAAGARRREGRAGQAAAAVVRGGGCAPAGRGCRPWGAVSGGSAGATGSALSGKVTGGRTSSGCSSSALIAPRKLMYLRQRTRGLQSFLACLKVSLQNRFPLQCARDFHAKQICRTSNPLGNKAAFLSVPEAACNWLSYTNGQYRLGKQPLPRHRGRAV